MTIFRAAALPQTLALALAVLFASACSGPTPADKPGEKTGASRAAPPSATSDDDEDDEGGMGSGTLSFQLQPGAAMTLPVTFCAGHGTIFTVAGKEGETQVDLRLIELPALRDGKPLDEIASVGYRFTGSDQGRAFNEIWQTKSIKQATRDGDTTRARGTLYGLRSYDKGNGVGTTPESTGADRDFSLEVTCSPP